MRFLLTGSLLLSLPCVTISSFAEAVKDREGAVRKDRATMENDARWIYNDYYKGFDQAQRTKKPLLVVLRCVPCLSCMGMDAAILSEKSLQPLLDQFVCVRLINANAIDLAQFQFDYDLSFSTMFFNGDGTVYGRYGSWTHQKNPYDSTLEGYRRALEGVLAIHKQYPANKAALGGKQGAPMPFRTPVEIPLLASKYRRELDWEGKVVGSCVHCHQIGDAFRTWYRAQGKPVPAEWIHPMPAPETVGLTLAPDQIAKVTEVAAGSAAEKAAFQPGDELVLLAGQPLISTTDVSWILHRSADEATLPAVVKRAGSEQTLALTLPAGWRLKSDFSKRSSVWSMRGMATGGMVLEDLPDEERAKRGLNNSQLALWAKGVGQYGNHAAAKNAGFQKDDVIVEIDGKAERMTESALIDHFLAQRMPGSKVKTTVLRGNKRIDLMLPMQ
jgi:serine protease Do